MELDYIGFEITKVDKQADGSVIVWGPCTNGDVDSDRQIIDPSFAAKGLADWLRTGANVREMHQPKAIGVGTELVREGDTHFLKSKVVDANAVGLVLNKVLTSYSVGISNARIVKDVTAPGGRIVGGTFVEVSLVDRPANAACKVDLVEKREDGSARFTSILKASMPDGNVSCPTCKGDGMIRGGKVKCPDCAGDGNMPKATVGSDGKPVKKSCGLSDCTVCASVFKGTLSTAQRADLDDADFAYVDSNGGRHLPIHDAGHVQAALGRFGQTKFETDAAKKGAAREIVSRAKSLGIDVGTDTDVAQAAKRRGANPIGPAKPTDDDEGDKWGEGNRQNQKAKLPKPDKDVTSALESADDDIDAAQDAQAKDNAAHMSGDDETDDDAKKGAVPYVVKRLHDASCACYSNASVLSAHQTLDTLADAFDPGYWQNETTKAFADGPVAAQPVLAMYAMVNQLAALGETEITTAHASLHKMFTQAYPDVHLSPTAIAPGQFRRPFVMSGRASMKPGAKPKMPAGATSISPSQFDRGYVSSGRAANSPMAGPAHSMTKSEVVDVEGVQLVKVVHEQSGKAMVGVDERSAYKALRTALAGDGVELPTWKQRTFYTNNAKDQAASVMQGVHDYIVANHPAICSMKQGSDDDDAGDAEPAPDKPEMMDNQADAKPMPVSKADVRKMVETAVDEATTDLVKRVEKAERKLAKAKATITKLEAQPVEDGPSYRGPRVLPFVPKRSDAASDTEGPEARAKVERAEEIEWLRKQAGSNDSESRRMAITKLQGMCSSDELADVLTSL